MKHLIFYFILTTVIISQTSGQEKRKTNVFRINAGAIVGIADFSYERTFAKRHSFTIAPSYCYLKSGDARYKTYGGSAEYRYYFSKSKMSPAGFYGGAGSGYALGKGTLITKPNDPPVDVKAFNIYGVFGKQWILHKGWCIDANIGVQNIQIDYKYKSSSATTNVKIGNYENILPAFTVGFGYAF